MKLCRLIIRGQIITSKPFQRAAHETVSWRLAKGTAIGRHGAVCTDVRLRSAIYFAAEI